MSFWPRPSTADIGLRVYAPTYGRLLADAALGMLDIVASPAGTRLALAGIRHTSTWTIDRAPGSNDDGLLLVSWLDEVLYNLEVHGRWLVDAQFLITTGDEHRRLEAQVSWVDGQQIEREVEIKAVTTHELAVVNLMAGEEMSSPWPDVPSMSGPGWAADVLFDI